MERQKKRWEDETLLHIGRREAQPRLMRSGMQPTDISLNGTWKQHRAPEYIPPTFHLEHAVISNTNSTHCTYPHH